MKRGRISMRVLLLSRSRVVQELVKLGIGGVESAVLEIAEEPARIAGDRYDLLLLDDRFAREFASLEIGHLLTGDRVLLGSAEGVDPEVYDRVLEKPFLPADIRALASGVGDPAEEVDVEEDLREFLTGELAAAESEETEVLDREEIRKIRALLDGGESEDFEVPEERATPVREAAAYRADELLDLLERIKTKKLRRLLRGATIRIEIDFPEEEA
jgi:hypothetical protein